MEWLNKLYKWVDEKFDIDKTYMIGSQVLNFYTTKVIVHIPAHFLIGVIVAWLSFPLWLCFGASTPIAMWIGFYGSCIFAFGVTMQQIIWENLYVSKDMSEEEIKKRHSGILMNIFDFVQYVLGAGTILFLLLKYV